MSAVEGGVGLVQECYFKSLQSAEGLWVGAVDVTLLSRHVTSELPCRAQ